MARQGKIARLPASIRRELNERIADGELGPQLLPWLNDLEETKAVLEAFFESREINPQNLSDWRDGGYSDWLKTRRREDAVRRLAEHSRALAKAGGGSMSEGAMAVASGRILELLELAADGDSEDIDITDLVMSLSKLGKLEVDREKLELEREKEQTRKDQLTLSREKFESQTIEQFLKWAASKEAQNILSNGKPKRIQAELLRELMFGPVEDE